MKKKFLSIFFALVLVLSFSLVTAVPAAAVEPPQVLKVIPFSLTCTDDEDTEAVWGDQAGDIAVHLTTGPKEGDGDTATIVISASDVGITTLADVTSISWDETSIGYPAHVDIMIDTNGDESIDDALVIEYAYNEGSHPLVTDSSNAWLTSRDPGPLGADPDVFAYHTLGEWKTGVTVAVVVDKPWVEKTIDGSTSVVALEIEVDNWIMASASYIDDITINGMVYYGSIQDAIDSASPLDTISVAAGTYDEQVDINWALTLQGAGDTTIIQPSGPGLVTTSSIPWFGGTPTTAAIVSVDTTGDEVTIKDLKIDGSLITTTSTTWVAGLVYLETSGTIENLTVIGYPDIGCRSVGIWASALTETALVEVTECTIIDQNRAGIYAYGATMTADYNHNQITGPGELATQVPNGFFFLEGAKGSATYNTITDMAYDGAVYRSSGIGTYRPGADLIFGHNEIYNVQNAFAIAGGLHATIEYNDIHDCHTGVKLEAIGDNRASNTNIQYNDIYDNDFAIRCGTDMGDGNEAHYNNFVGNLGAEWVWGDDTWIGAVCNVHETYKLDATNNWWGNASGPNQVDTNPGGTGNAVSENVEYVPWLTRDFQQVLDDNFAYFGYPMVHLDTGWNTFSTPIALDPACDTWGDYKALGDGLNVMEGVVNAYWYDAGASQPHFVPLASDYVLEPCDAIYVRMTEPDIAAILYSPETSAPTKEVYPGWNLIGLAWLPTAPGEGMPVEDALTSLYKVPGDFTGYSMVVSPPFYQEPWTFVRDGDSKFMYPTWGYWVFMENGPDTLAGSTFTPMSLSGPPPPPPGVVTEVSFQWYPVTIGSADLFEQYDDDSFEYTLPWTFPFAGKDIVAIEVTSNGLIELLESGETSAVTNSYDYMMALAGDYPDSDIIFAWFDDLDSGNCGFYGVEYNGEVVVVHWETPTCSDDAPDYMNYFQLWLFPDGSIKWNFKEFNYEYFSHDLGTGIYDSTSHTLFNVAYAMGEPDLIFNTPEKSYEISGEYMP